MHFHETNIDGVYLIEPERLLDERGFFARLWCRQAFAARGLETAIEQCSLSSNDRRGTLRGLHFQAPPHAETKLVRCARGAIYDVVLDLRNDSPSFGRWQAFELTGESHHTLYIPPGVAHGFLTLCDHCEVVYQMSVAYHADSARGVRWNDPAFGIDWPETPRVISQRDASFADWPVIREMLATGGRQ